MGVLSAYGNAAAPTPQQPSPASPPAAATGRGKKAAEQQGKATPASNGQHQGKATPPTRKRAATRQTRGKGEDTASPAEATTEAAEAAQQAMNNKAAQGAPEQQQQGEEPFERPAQVHLPLGA